VRFWDTSALLPLFVDEPSTESCRELLRADPFIIVWEGTGVEMLSALARYQRHSSGMDDVWPAVRHEMLRRWRMWMRVNDWTRVCPRAQRLVTLHPLKAGDAFQLAAALAACDDEPDQLAFVTRDVTLADAARLEGFPIVTPGR
jgi:predicted nucleic acid-binding protein